MGQGVYPSSMYIYIYIYIAELFLNKFYSLLFLAANLDYKEVNMEGIKCIIQNSIWYKLPCSCLVVVKTSELKSEFNDLCKYHTCVPHIYFTANTVILILAYSTISFN